MDRVSDERLDEMIGILEKWFGIYAIDNTKALKELRARREAERRPDPCVAEWTDMECPQCGHEAVCRDRAGYHCTIDGCGWTKDEPVNPDPLSQALNEGDGTYRP
jgi:ribosomal protein S27E